MNKARTYALVGPVLALGAPLGLCATRSILAGHAFSPAFVLEDVRALAGSYLYVALSTSLVFFILGALLGHKEDRLIVTSMTDPLTGLWNRRHLDGRLRTELARARRYQIPLTLLIVDVDRLKAINDSGGHLAGDQALLRVAGALEEACRETDVVARFGGDEFAILAPHTESTAALDLAERVRKAVEGRSPGAKGPPVTVSIGIADLEAAGAGGDTALRDAADAAVYQAKREGRNRSVRAPPRTDED